MSLKLGSDTKAFSGIIVNMKSKVFLGLTVFVVIIISGFLYLKEVREAENKVAISNPASRHCIEAGGLLSSKTTSDGATYGMCVFPDGRVCEEWAFIKGECKDVTDPLTVPAEAVTLKDENEFYTISVTYPVETSDQGEVLKQFAESLFKEKQELWRLGGEAHQQELKLKEEFPDKSEPHYDFLLTYSTSTSAKLGTATYIFSGYEATGGANGNLTINTFTFGEHGELKIEDIIDFNKESNDIALTKILAKKIAEDESLASYTDTEMIEEGLGLDCLDEDEIFDAEACQADGYFFPSNFMRFVPQDDGLIFIMDKYAVAAGVANTPEVPFTWDELLPFLNSDFLVPN